LEDNRCGGCRLDPKKSRREIFLQIFALRIVWGGVSHYATTPLIVALSPGNSDITKFCPWSPIVSRQKIVWIMHNKKISKVAQTTGIIDVFDPRSGILGPTSQRASACPNLHE
jgi:hypothetical protein